MKNKEKQNLKSLIKSISSRKEEGITLVALVVTIIILLILAGVAINMALGDNGLFKKSKEAVNTWKSAEENETEVLDYLDTEWENLINGGTHANPTTPPEEPPKPQGPILTGETVDNIKLPENTETQTTVAIGGEEVTIPPKFTIAEDSGKTVSEGIAVVDSQGNEWVWVPCYVPEGKGSNIEGRVKYDRYIFGNQVFDETDNSKIYYDSSSKTYHFHETLSETSPEYQSIKKYGGYYIGRYEAGDKESTELKEMRTEEKYSNSYAGDATHTVTIKKNQAPYNYVTQAQSITLSEGMTSADGSNKEKLNGTQVFTKLCSSYSWDTALKFIQNKYSEYPTNSTQGNYKDATFNYKDIAGVAQTKSENEGVLIPTGQTTPVCSIYDMGGNLWEYTTGSCTGEEGSYVHRGGIYDYDDSVFPAGFRSDYNGGAVDISGFRATLFVK